MNYLKRGKYFCLLILSVLLISSCTAKISGQLGQGGEGNFSVSMTLMPRFSGFIKALQDLTGEQNAPIIDGQYIADSLAGAPGITSVSFKNTAANAFEGPLTISGINDFLASANVSGFISFEQSRENKAGHFSMNLNKQMGPELLSLISPDISDYLEVLMAPIVTGEAMSNAEYLNQIAMFYGADIKNEIAGSVIHISVDFPGNIQSVKNGVFKGRRAEFNISLPDILVLEKPLNYEVVWR
jgi:hypothetical protein